MTNKIRKEPYRTVEFHHGSNMWIVIETDPENQRQRYSKGGWYNSTDAENALFEDFEWDVWF